MYIPEAFRETRPEALHDLIRQNSFGILVSDQRGEQIASHLPFLLDSERGPQGSLLGHMARANPQWRHFQEGTEVLAIFPGPHAYISPSWYQPGSHVPTWNYTAVHAYGMPRLIEETDTLYGILKATVQMYEAPLDEPWALPSLDSYVAPMMKAIVGFEIRITRLEGKLKLGQNRPAADQQRVIAALTQQGEPLGLQIAQMMRTAAEPGDAPPTGAGSLTTDD